MNFVWEVKIGSEMKLKVKEGNKITEGDVMLQEEIVDGVDINEKILKTIKAPVDGRVIMVDKETVGIEYGAEIVKVENIDGGNKWADGVVKIESWREVNQDKVEKKLVLMENPESVMVAKCEALGAVGVIIKKDAKIESWMTAVVVNENEWDKIVAESGKWHKVWVDEAGLRLLIVL